MPYILRIYVVSKYIIGNKKFTLYIYAIYNQGRILEKGQENAYAQFVKSITTLMCNAYDLIIMRGTSIFDIFRNYCGIEWHYAK